MNSKPLVIKHNGKIEKKEKKENKEKSSINPKNWSISN